MIHGRYVAGKSNTVCPAVLKSFFKNTQLPHLPKIGFQGGGLCIFSRLFLIFGDDSQVSSTDSFTDSS